MEEIVTSSDRTRNWLKSYIGGHAMVLEGRIDVVNNRLVRVDRKEMIDIMGPRWRPMLESELLRHVFTKLHKYAAFSICGKTKKANMFLLGCFWYLENIYYNTKRMIETF
jgi:hypothetical protein